MSSQTSIAQTSFLEDCISKRRSFQDIYEALGLYSETADARKEPVFVKDEANDLQKRVKEIAASFKASYRNDRDALLADLVKDGAFNKQTLELGEHYGQSLWGRKSSWPSRYGGQQVSALDFQWDRDQESICFYIRCWITRHAVQLSTQRKGKSKASVVPQELSGSEHSDIEQPRMAVGSHSMESPNSRFVAAEAASMLPPKRMTNSQARPDVEASPKALNIALPQSPTTPNKRKAQIVLCQSGSGKLQKVIQDARSDSLPRVRQRDMYSVPKSPAPGFQTLLKGLVHRGQRESTCDTDRTYAPPREPSAETDDPIDQDDIMLDTQGLLSDVDISSADFRAVQAPIAGPSGTYRSLQRQDSVIPISTQPDDDYFQEDRVLHGLDGAPDSTRGIWQSTSVPTPRMDISNLSSWQDKQLRMELFKLLLSYLNGLNQFDAEAYELEAEERMNHLLYQFWINDAETLRSKMGARFPELQTAWHRWITMRHQLTEFQRTTGYFGKPGDDWKEHLRTIDRVAHAKSSIAFVDLKTSASIGIAATGAGPQFDNDVATVFDLLTQVEGCNGVEEFEEALRVYNEGLLEWFS